MLAFQVIAVLLWLASIGCLAYVATRPRPQTGSRVQRRGAPTEAIGTETEPGPRTEHLSRGQPATVRVANSPAPGAQPTTKLVPKETPKPSQQDSLARANRLEQLGFHTGVAPTVAPAAPAAVAAEPVAPPAPVPAPAAPATPDPASEEEPPRLQTSDLDAILSRIDQVLADTAAPTKPAEGDAARATQPMPGRAEPPEGQQRLF
jgi:hypothetical protein